MPPNKNNKHIWKYVVLTIGFMHCDVPMCSTWHYPEIEEDVDVGLTFSELETQNGQKESKTEDVMASFSASFIFSTF